MFTRSDDNPPMIDSVYAGKAEIVQHQGDLQFEVTMVYANSKTGSTYGSCPIKNNFFSPETIESLRRFLQLAEEDYGKFVFTEGKHSSANPDTAESQEGLKFKGLGGT